MKVAVNLKTKTIVDILPDSADENSGFIRNNGYGLLDVENPILNYIEKEDGSIEAKFRELTNAELSPYLLTDINADYQREIALITSGIPTSEISTWTKQEQEARAYLLDSNASTPFIDAICLARECDKSYLVGKIIEKADAYVVAVGTLTGIRQRLEKEISGE